MSSFDKSGSVWLIRSIVNALRKATSSREARRLAELGWLLATKSPSVLSHVAPSLFDEVLPECLDNTKSPINAAAMGHMAACVCSTAMLLLEVGNRATNDKEDEQLAKRRRVEHNESNLPLTDTISAFFVQLSDMLRQSGAQGAFASAFFSTFRTCNSGAAALLLKIDETTRRALAKGLRRCGLMHLGRELLDLGEPQDRRHFLEMLALPEYPEQLTMASTQLA
eukprot:m.90973 g.90973  ORF g.90973 m.90973 type:complete len:224 (-) comp8583_c0_seq1:111-782(-)